jgi:diguanylate cyclase (GGDEF)-like protein
MNRLADYLAPQLLRSITLRNIALGHRLAGALMLLSLLPLAISSAVSYAESNAAIRQRSGALSTEVVKQVAKNIGFEMARLESDSEALVLTDPIQRALADYADADEARRAASRRQLPRALLEHYGSLDFLNQKYLLDRDNRIIDAQVFAMLGQGVAQFAGRVPKVLGRSSWGIYDNAAGQKSMVLLRAIQDKSTNQLIGSLFLGVRPSHFAAIFDDVNLGSGSAVFVLDADAGQVVAEAFFNRDGAGTAAAATAPVAALTSELRRSLQRNGRSGVVGYSEARDGHGDGHGSGHEAGERLAAYAQIGDTSWFVVGAMPLAQLATEAHSVRDKNLLIGLAGLLVSIALALILARSIAAPLAKLAHGMRETAGRNYASRVTPEGKDELSALARQFNDMAGKLEQHQLELEQRVAERSADLAVAKARLAALSVTDSLTGVANRRRFDEVLAGEIARAARAGVPLALLMVDVDFFKHYNEAYGHQQGDDCLRRIGGLLQSHARRTGDLAARFGGAQFVMIAFDTNRAGALALGEAIRASLEALQLAHARSPLGRVTASIGVVSTVPDESSSYAAMLRLVGQAMVRAKELGRNQVAKGSDPGCVGAGESGVRPPTETPVLGGPVRSC